MAITADELLLGAPSVGLRIRNLFQVNVAGTEMWQANLCHENDTEGFNFGRGATPTAALIEAYRIAGVKVEDDGQ